MLSTDASLSVTWLVLVAAHTHTTQCGLCGTQTSVNCQVQSLLHEVAFDVTQEHAHASNSGT